MTKNPSHIHSRNAGKEFPSNDRLDVRDLEERNEARSAGLPAEEPRNVLKAGGGEKGQDLGGAHTGRSQSRPDADLTKERAKGRR